MSEKDVANFFAAVYDDKSLQGAMFGALCDAAPEVVAEIAKKKGYEFSKDELAAVMKPAEGELSEDELAAVAGGARLSSATVAQTNLKTNFWKRFSPSRFGGGIGQAAFGLGIPGPSFVLVMSDEERAEPETAAQESPVSAAELYETLR